MESKAKRYSKALIKILEDIKSTYEYNLALIDEKEKETQDLLHEIELGEFKSKRGHQLAKELKAVRKARRKALDENITLKFLYDYFKNKSILNDLKSLQGQIIKEEAKLPARVYRPRVRNDLTIAAKEPTAMEKAFKEAK